MLVATMLDASAVGSAATPVVLYSPFAADAEGWHVTTGATVSDPTYVSTGGNPGGYIELANDHPTKRFVAPVSWETDLSGDYGGTISFDLRVDDTAPDDTYARVELYRSLTAYAAEATAVPLTAGWTRYTVRLLEDRWCAAGQPCTLTRSSFTAFLANTPVLRIQIYNQALEATTQHTDLDNVVVAGPKLWSRHVTIKYRRAAGAFKGHLGTRFHGCRSHQKIRVLKKHKGPDIHIGSDTTNSAGYYVVHHPPKRGTYYAEVPDKILTTAAVECGAGVSSALKLT
jgi:hypothetical protein